MSEVRILIGGPKNSGKSVFARHFQLALQNLGVTSYYFDYDPFSPTKLLMQGDITEEEREALKKKDISDGDANKLAAKFLICSVSFDIVVGDLPGQITTVTEILAKRGTHAIIICDKKVENEIGEWKGFFEGLGLPIKCIIRTTLGGSEHVDPNDLMNVELSNLKRELKPNEITPNIRVLAEILIPELS